MFVAALVVGCAASFGPNASSWYRLEAPSTYLKVQSCMNIGEGMWGDPEGTCEEQARFTTVCYSCGRGSTTWFVKDAGTCDNEHTKCHFRSPEEKCIGALECPSYTSSDDAVAVAGETSLSPSAPRDDTPAAAVAAPAATTADCSFQDSYPQQYVVHKTAVPPVMDGSLDDALWKEVPFTELFVDIANTVKPRYQTKAKLRYDDKFIYVGAEISEPEVWANITHTCHCLNNTEDQVIFHDNDFEIFTNPDGTTHYYKEYEMNALNQTWDLLLKRAYGDGGGENSTRTDGKNGWDMQPPLYCATKVQGTINDPSDTDKGWSVEVALPLEKLGFNQLASLNVPPLDGDFWRMDFSRVEYHVNKVGNHYEKTAAPCDNWVWSPIGVVDMHNPDRWGMLQFSTGKPGQVKQTLNPEWPLRESAMATYYAQHAYKGKHGNFTEDLAALVPYIPSWLNVGPQAIDGTCAKGAVTTNAKNGTFDVTFTSLDGKAASHVNDIRYLTVTKQ